MWVVICRCGTGGAGSSGGATASRFFLVPPAGWTFLSEPALRALTSDASSRIAVVGRTFRSCLAAATRWSYRQDVVRRPNKGQMYFNFA